LGFLPIIHHVLLVYSPFVSKYISEKGFDLQAKSDYRFVENTFKLLLSNFGGYKPQITLQQFFTNGFGECKIIMCTEIIRLMKSKHKELMAADAKKNTKATAKPPVPSMGHSNSQRQIFNLSESKFNQVEQHDSNPSSFSQN